MGWRHLKLKFSNRMGDSRMATLDGRTSKIEPQKGQKAMVDVDIGGVDGGEALLPRHELVSDKDATTPVGNAVAP
jgi:hypothetical protein